MNVNAILGNLAMLSAFHAIGGIAFGFALKQLRQRISANAIFFLIWGVAFGIAPFGNGFEIFQNAHVPFLVIVEVIVFAAAIAAAFFLDGDFMQEVRSPNVLKILTGGFCLFAGLIAGFFATRQNFLGGLFMGLIFASAGAALLVMGVRGVMKEK